VAELAPVAAVEADAAVAVADAGNNRIDLK
jgi:hypothetical protein